MPQLGCRTSAEATAGRGRRCRRGGRDSTPSAELLGGCHSQVAEHQQQPQPADADMEAAENVISGVRSSKPLLRGAVSRHAQARIYI